MAMVLIRCPNTGKPLATGIGMDPGSFASSTLLNNTVGPCPHCGQNHTWSKKDAWLEGAQPPAGGQTGQLPPAPNRAARRARRFGKS